MTSNWTRREILSAIASPMVLGALPPRAVAGKTMRGAFIINPDGTLMNSEVNFYNMGRNIDELMRKFKANLYLSRKSDEGCPSKWKDEGDKTLKPSAKMVGHVYEAVYE